MVAEQAVEAEREVHGMRGEHRDKYDQNDRAVWFASLVADLMECDEVPVQVLVQGDNPVQVLVPVLDDETVQALVSAPVLHDGTVQASASDPALHDGTVQALVSELALHDETAQELV